MTFIVIAIIGFLLLESTNVAALYFFPDSKFANSVGVFKAWEKSKATSKGTSKETSHPSGVLIKALGSSTT